jgi:multiple sugar transport system substrate-binding protein
MPLTSDGCRRLDPADFHTAGWQAAHWGGRPYGVPSANHAGAAVLPQGLFADAGHGGPATTADVLKAAKRSARPEQRGYGIAWNAARGTALGHTFMMTCADFGQPILDLPPIAGRL